MSRALVLLLLCALPCAAADLASLQADGKLRLRSWLEPDDAIVVGQEVRLVVEIATPRWFAGGTRVHPPEIEQVVVLQRDGFASNLSRREAGATWVLQQWRLELYPQRAGTFEVPPVGVELAVNDADAGIVRGSLQTERHSFAASVPPLLLNTDSWLATPDFSVTSSEDRPLEALQPGDAFSRTVELRATEIVAMMLPEPAVPSLPGLAAYPDPPQLENRSNRGEATAIRRQRITYVVERAGQYRLPEQSFYWWNTDAGRVETATLAALDIDAGLAAASGPEHGETSAKLLHKSTAELALLAVLVLALLLATRWWRGRRRIDKPEAERFREAVRALRRGDSAGTARALYAWLNARRAAPTWLSLRDTVAAADRPGASEAAEALLESVYSRRASASAPASARQLDLRLLRRGDTRRRRAGTAAGDGLNPPQPRK